MSNGFVIWTDEYGYYDGRILHADGINYLAYITVIEDASVKVYTSEHFAIRAAEKVKKACQYVNDYRILPR